MNHHDYAHVARCALARAKAAAAPAPRGTAHPDHQTADAMNDLAWSHWKRLTNYTGAAQ